MDEETKLKMDTIGKSRVSCESLSREDGAVAAAWAARAWKSLRKNNEPSACHDYIICVIEEAVEEGRKITFPMLWGKLKKATPRELERREEKRKKNEFADIEGITDGLFIFEKS